MMVHPIDTNLYNSICQMNELMLMLHLFGPMFLAQKPAYSSVRPGCGLKILLERWSGNFTFQLYLGLRNASPRRWPHRFHSFG
jgi:hypothetical protein